MSGNLRKAPPRTVLDIWRTGTYGQAQWHHRLECGHVETRKRKAPAAEIKCRTCLDPQDSPGERGARYDPQVAAQALDQRVTAGLAARFDLDPALITVAITVDSTDTPVISYAQIVLPIDELRRKGLL